MIARKNNTGIEHEDLWSPYPKRFYLLVFGIIMVVLLGGTLFTLWEARSEEVKMRAQLLTETRLAQSSINWRYIQSLTGTEADLSSLDYLRLKEQLTLMRSSQPQYRFMYLIGRKSDGTVFFFLDSESIDSPDYSQPGQVYPEVTNACRQVFTTRKETTEGPVTDRWGK
ncbi:MAG: hypothetical protein WCU00_12305, partial [Candidatus Latescibacterota bacterium]